MSNGDTAEWICSALQKRPEAGETRGLADERLLWAPDQELQIGFLHGSTKLQDRVFETAQRWTAPDGGGANLVFARTDDPESAHIRISFNEAAGFWSHVGKDALAVPESAATMNLGWATETTPEKDFASLVLHEFGHALGLLHEHNHPDLKLRWKKDVVYADLGGPPNHWSKDIVDYNVFEQYPEERVATRPTSKRRWPPHDDRPPAARLGGFFGCELVPW
ncbi:zinc metalloprotease [Thauera sinica]|uniref:Peptidase metallopeptidase domain-containing protein n=1 Tax=Thauera sinica TaxID=2665146 RepID=A0ABW1AQZ9_9RHOO|nr:hypothetical protein [Thauera sp. K11]